MFGHRMTLIAMHLLLFDMSIESMNSLLLAVKNSNKIISNQVPQHVTGSCHVIVNMSSLNSRLDITVHSWSWILRKIYLVSFYTTNSLFKKDNNARHYRAAKQVHKCKTAEALKNA